MMGSNKLRVARCMLILDAVQRGRKTSYQVSRYITDQKVQRSLEVTPKQVSLYAKRFLADWVLLSKDGGRTTMTVIKYGNRLGGQHGKVDAGQGIQGEVRSE